VNVKKCWYIHKSLSLEVLN